MDTPSAETLHRTVKLELDEGRAESIEAAERIVEQYVLQIDVGEAVSRSATRQAMLLTAVNASRRAFIGGVRVRLSNDAPMTLAWAEGRSIAEAVEAFGAETVDALSENHPTLVIGEVSPKPVGSALLYTTWQGWTGGVVEQPEDRLPESVEFPLAGMLAGALGVSESFQHVRGFAPAGRRPAGLSLWNPEADWRDPSAYGEPSPYLPSSLWLIGLGHLGQAYAWALALLPYPDLGDVKLMLQDYDCIVEANESTGVLSDGTSIDRRKTRVVSERLEALGLKTVINERPFDSTTQRRADEPGVALVGVDDPGPRRLVEEAGFDLIVDAGLGGTTQSYLDILIHSFPSGIEASRAWTDRRTAAAAPLVDQLAYQDLRERLSGDDGDIECGVLEIAGRSVGAAFVGCVAATLVVAEVLRFLAGGPRFEVLSVSLRSPHLSQAVSNTRQSPPANPGFVVAE